MYVAVSGSPRGGPGVRDEDLPPPDRAQDGIAVVDLEHGNQLSRLPGGPDPESFDLSQDGKLLLISNEHAKLLSVVEIAAAKVVAQVPVGGEPEGVKASPDGKLVFVTSEGDGEIDIVDAKAWKPVAKVPLAPRPRGIVFTPDYARPFVSCEQGATVDVIDVRKRARGGRRVGQGHEAHRRRRFAVGSRRLALTAVLRRLALAAALCALAAQAQESDGPGETIVVTPTRAPGAASDSPTRVDVVHRREIEQRKALDEALRDDPSFEAFRRSSSLVADPSSQGVNLRGIGPSGVSRALVLQDGVPVNDGFGGWVYWGKVPRLSLQRVEIAPGGASGLYGSAALGGVVQLVSRPITDRAELELSGGSFGTVDGALSVGKRFSDSLALGLDAEGLTTNGYPVLAAPGPIDHDASSRRGSAQLRVEGQPFGGFTASARAAGFSESEDGGTLDTTARARQGEVGLGLEGHGLEAHFYGRLARFDQDRAAIAPNPFVRSSASLASIQGAPADDEGLSAVWHEEGFSAGFEGRRVAGRSVEQVFPQKPGIVHRETAGEQLLGGIFAEELLRLSNVELQGALRLDGWRNHSSGRVETLSSGDVQETNLPARSDLQLSPRLGALYKPIAWLGLRAAAYRSFRAPTLNELYRPFQVGPVRTDGNPQLGPETLYGAEAGFDLFGLAHATAFWSRLDDPIVNVTVGPNLAQRQNLGAARIAGIELRAQSPAVHGVRLDAGWTYVRTRVIGSADDDRELPQDPHHRITAGVAYDGWLSAEVRLRWTSDQYEDDLNTFRLPGFATFDAYVSRKLSQQVTVFGAAENLLDRRYLVGLQGGVATLGQPLSLRAGVRLAL